MTISVDISHNAAGVILYALSVGGLESGPADSAGDGVELHLAVGDRLGDA